MLQPGPHIQTETRGVSVCLCPKIGTRRAKGVTRAVVLHVLVVDRGAWMWRGAQGRQEPDDWHEATAGFSDAGAPPGPPLSGIAISSAGESATRIDESSGLKVSG
jgi:hypothetical protein